MMALARLELPLLSVPTHMTPHGLSRDEGAVTERKQSNKKLWCQFLVCVPDGVIIFL